MNIILGDNDSNDDDDDDDGLPIAKGKYVVALWISSKGATVEEDEED